MDDERTGCTACGAEARADQHFCGVCGCRLSAVDAGDGAVTATSVPRSAGVLPTGASIGVGRVTSTPAGSDGRFVPGTVLGGRYRIVGLLGSGGMGEVCRADDLKLGQPVALKFLPEALEQREDRLERLLNEVRVARQISHPNVCRVYDIGEIDGRHFISMEYVDGEDLATLLRRIGRLPEDKAVQIARQLCAGLAAAHDRGILHRDLKPANVMIDGRGQVRITDFGLSDLAERITGAEVRAGTPDYMAPEQLDGTGVSVRSDLYALGHVLYELFTGTRVFEAAGEATREEITRRRRETTPTSPSTLIEALDPAVERVIMRCLDSDPEQRPGSALAVAAALPGGDPIAAALAAGETPSPEMIAAAGPRGGLQVRDAAIWCAVFVVTTVLCAILADRVTLTGLLRLERPIVVLEDRAREIVGRLGFSTDPADRASGVFFHQEELKAIADADSSPTRWEPLGMSGQTAVALFYRQASRPLAPANLRGAVGFDDPPARPGDVTVQLDLDGRLRYLRAIPPLMDEDPGVVAPEPNWSELLESAGFDVAELEATDPLLRPAVPSDRRAAWHAELPESGGVRARIEAAALEGRPTYFRVISEHSRFWSADQPEDSAIDRAGPAFLLGLMFSILAGALALAWRNWRRGRGDRRGALRIALVVFGLRLLVWLIGGHHVLDPGRQFDLVLVATGSALLLGAAAWLGYMAIEPYFRRQRPAALVSWTRMLAGRIGDPLVARHLLIGFAVGPLLVALDRVTSLAPTILGRAVPTPLPIELLTLRGGRHAIAEIVQLPLMSLIAPMFIILVMVLLQAVLRNALAAQIGFVIILTIQGLAQWFAISDSYEPTLLAWWLVVGLVQSTILLLLLWRSGLLAIGGCFMMTNLLMRFPITTDVAAPQFGIGLTALAVAAALVVLAVWRSTSGRAALAGAFDP